MEWVLRTDEARHLVRALSERFADDPSRNHLLLLEKICPVLKQMDDLLEVKWKKKTAKAKKEEAFYRDVRVHLLAVKLAWRG